VAALRRVRHRLLRRSSRGQLRDLPAAGPSPPEPATFSRRDASPVMEHRGVVRHQHQLAGLLRRVDDVVPVPDGRAGGAELPQRRCRDRSRRCAEPGFARKGSKTIGNFWVDLVRGTIYVLLPIAFVFAVVFIAQGALQTVAGPVHVHDALNGASQVIPRGPVAPQETIKQLGTNGGGFFNANGASPFENPTGLTNFLSVALILFIPVALTYTLGKMVGSVRQGAAILGVIVIIFGSWLAIASVSEHQANPAIAAAGVTHQPAANVEGKEIRLGDTSSALHATASTQTSTGSVDAAEDSYTPMGGFTVLTAMMLGEVTPGGVGSGLYTILLFAIITVFIGGLMVGRTPEYLGKKIQAREVKLPRVAGEHFKQPASR
jgi:potassium-transporting ATPase potassium-binding subunit